MESEWVQLALGDLGKVITGKTPLTRVEGNFGGRILFVTPRDLNGARTINFTERYLTETGAESVKNAVIPAKAVMVSCIGSDMGKAAIAGKQCVTNQQINSIIVDEQFDYKYVYYNLSTRKDEIRGQAGGSAQPILNKGHFRQLDISLPPLHEQKTIAHVLGSLDDRIELNRRMNETLEAMAQALFKSWFVDFDPVIDNALAGGKEIPAELSEKAQARAALGDKRQPLPEEIRTLFPDEFTYSDELGWIPKRWEVLPLHNLMNVKHGFAFKGEYFSKAPTKDILLTPGNFYIGGGFKANKFKFYSGPVSDDYVLSENDLLVTMTDLSKAADTLGYPALVPEIYDNRFLHNQRIGKVEITNDKVGKLFVYKCLRQKKYRDEILSSATGTTVKHTSPTKILAYAIPFSGGCVEPVFETQSKSFTEKINKNNSNLKLLSKLRDTLLPKLLSGEIRIPDAEKMVEELAL